MKRKTVKRNTGILAIILICILVLSGIFVPISNMQIATAATTVEDVYNAGNNYEATIENATYDYTDKYHDNEIIHYEYKNVTYDLSKRDNSKTVSKNPPQITFLTHGLGGSAGHWSNNGTNGYFAYEANSIIEIMKQKAECNVYVADFPDSDKYYHSFNNFNLYQVTSDKDYRYISENDKNNKSIKKIDRITDNTRHSIVIFQADEPNGLNDYVYSQFNLMASTIVANLADLDAKHELPRVNLIGHSRGGITNLQYAMDHPDLVDSVFSIATPYVGSTSADIDGYLLHGKFSGNAGGDDIRNHGKYIGYMDRWNEGYNDYYSKIKVYSIGGYESLDTLLYSLICNYVDWGDSEMLLKIGLKAANAVISKWFVSHTLAGTAGSIQGLAKKILDAILSHVTFRQRIDILSGLTAALELLLCEISYNKLALSYDLLNDGLVDLPSQLGIERETGKIFNGFIRHTRRFNLMDDIDNIGFNVPSMPKVMHNIEAHDLRILTYIVGNINISHNLNGSPYIVAATGDNEVSILGYIGENSGDVLTIPNSIYVRGLDKSMNVTSIADRAFATTADDENQVVEDYMPNSDVDIPRCNNFKQVVIPRNVKKIGKEAFMGNTNLSSVLIEGGSGSQLTEIGEGAFSNTSVTSFTIPTNVDYIGERAFLQSKIQSFESQSKHFSWNSSQGLLINNNLTDTNKKIAVYASPNKTSVTIPDDVKILQANLFFGYTNLKSIDLNNTESIGPDAFTLSGLTTILGGDKVQDADLGAFFGTPWYPANNNDDTVAVGQVLVKAPADKEEIVVDEGFTRIAAGAFSGTNVVRVILPSTINSIGKNAFTDCADLEWVLIKAPNPPMTDGDCFGDNVNIYVRAIDIGIYESSMFFFDVKDNIKAKPVKVSYYTETGDYLGVKTEEYYSLYDNYIMQDITGQYLAYWIDSYGNKAYPDGLFDYMDDVTMTAHYENNKYQVMVGGDSMALEIGQEVDFGIPEKDDCIFIGWFDQYGNQITDNSGKGIWRFKDDDRILHAQFEGIPHKITYVKNGGEFDGDAPTEFSVTNRVTKGQIPELKKFGYVFQGWQIQNGGNAYFETTSELNSDICLVAVWKGNKVNAKVGLNDVTEEYAIFDMTNKTATSSYTFDIYPSTKYVSFIGTVNKEFSSMNIIVRSRDSSLVMGFENMNFHPAKTSNGLNGIDAIVCSGEVQLYVIYSGQNTISGGHGSDGTANSGQNGGNGGYGIRTWKVVLQSFSDSSYLTVKGGNGGNGSDGTIGIKGGDGIRPPRGSIFKPIKGDDGEAGGDGGNGGNGGNGGYAVYTSGGTDGFTITNTCAMSLIGGNGGNGGHGGVGGDGGKGASDTSASLSDGVGDPGNGGKGGNGGNGGDGGNDERGLNSSKIASIGGKGGSAGTGGNGGTGGKGGSSGTLGGSGSKGANGVIGVSGSAGYDAVSITPRAAVEQVDYPYFFNETALSAFIMLYN